MLRKRVLIRVKKWAKEVYVYVEVRASISIVEVNILAKIFHHVTILLELIKMLETNGMIITQRIER